MTKEEFCRSFEWHIDIKWFDLVGYTPVDANRRAKIVLSDRGYADHLDKLIVSILDKNEGEIDAKTFAFDDYLSRENRIDGRGDYPLGNNTCFCAWANRDRFEWYIAVPKTTRPLCEEIEKYIDIFR